MPKITTSATVVLHAPTWEEGDTLTILSAPTGFALEKIEGARRQFLNTASANPADVVVVGTPHEYNEAKLECAVVGGTFKDENGRTLPYTPELLKGLSPTDRTYIVGEIDRVWAPWLTPLSATTPEATKKAIFPGKGALATGPGGETGPGEPDASGTPGTDAKT